MPPTCCISRRDHSTPPNHRHTRLMKTVCCHHAPPSCCISRRGHTTPSRHPLTSANPHLYKKPYFATARVLSMRGLFTPPHTAIHTHISLQATVLCCRLPPVLPLQEGPCHAYSLPPLPLAFPWDSHPYHSTLKFLPLSLIYTLLSFYFLSYLPTCADDVLRSPPGSSPGSLLPAAATRFPLSRPPPDLYALTVPSVHYSHHSVQTSYLLLIARLLSRTSC